MFALFGALQRGTAASTVGSTLFSLPGSEFGSAAMAEVVVARPETIFISSIRMRALDLRGFRSEGFFKKQKKQKKTKKKQKKKTKKNKKKQKKPKKKQKETKKCKKDKKKKKKKKKKKSKNEQKTTRFLASSLWSRAFIYLHVVLQLGGGVRACQLFRPCCHHCLIVNCCQVLLTVTCSMKCNVSPSVLGVPGVIGMTRLIDLID